MKIGIEAQRIFRDNPHGMDVFAINLINELVNLKEVSQIVVFVNSPSKENNVLVKSEKISIENFTGQFALWEQIKLPRKAKKYDLDLIHFTSNTRSVRINVPVLTTLHDTFFLDQNPLFRRGFSMYQRFGNMYRRMLFAFPSIYKGQYITVSKAELDRIRSMYSLDLKGFIYNGRNKIFEPKGLEESQEILVKWGIKEPYIMHFGNTDPKKNTPRALEVIVEFLIRNKEHHAVIFDYQIDDNELMAPDEVKNRIKLLGYVPQSDLPYIYSMTDALFYPSLQESFGIPQIEALACETPVISGDCPALVEVSHKCAIHIDPKDNDAMLKALNDCVGKSTLTGDALLKAKKVVAGYNWKTTAEQYLLEYKKLC